MPEHILITLSKRYPQLLLPIDPATPNSEAYREAVLRGKTAHGLPDFSFSPEDRLDAFETPAGTVEALFLNERADFEHALRALAYRCDKKKILPSVGASVVIGLNNWEKIRAHRIEFYLAGGRDWSEEFKRFTAVKSNYKDTLILLSAGEYSAIPAQRLGLEQAEWIEKSRIIRCYHELTHFVCRNTFPGDTDEIRDEVLADLIGVVAAFGRCDTDMVRLFLGIENGAFREGGRLAHYAAAEKLPMAAERAESWLESYGAKLAGCEKENVFDLMIKVF